MRRFVFNFKRQFAQAVQDGTKRQTIRQNRADGKWPVPGDIACCYTGLRTSKTELLRESLITSVRTVRIECAGNGELFINGDPFTGHERAAFAQADGFKDWPSMLEFFKTQYKQDTFYGFCVTWEP